MSGHSKWSQIKHKKSIEDVKRSKLFSKLSKVITLAAREKGINPQINFKLRIAIENAKSLNMPSDNIERAIKKGGGINEKDNQFEELILEGFGYDNIPLIIESITDNKNRTLSEIRTFLSKYNGKLSNEGSVKWMFDYICKVEIKINTLINLKKIEELLINLVVLNLKQQDDKIIILIKPNNFELLKNIFEQNEIKIESYSFEYISKIIQENKDEKKQIEINSFLELLKDHDDVKNVYTNLW